MPAGLIGERVNNYEVVSVLGEGGMGAVYLATHPFMGRKAAIKVLRRELAEDPGLVERFMNEARAANAIHHPNIIDIIDVGRLSSGIPYLMMEFLEGESLAQRIARQRPLDVPLAVNIAKQTAAALGAAHGKGIVHRDLKPDNLFLVPDGEQQFGARVKVLDFGIAKLRGELSGSGAKTQSGSVMGTPPYMSPEQCRGITDEIDHRTDIYALGIILYEMLTGAAPFMSEGWGEVVLMHVTKPPPPPRQKNAQVSPELEAVVLKALAKAPGDRWQSMADLATALRNAVALDGSKFTTGAPASGRASTTLRTAAGEVSGPQMSTAVVADRDDEGVPRASRRPVLWVMGGLAAAGVVALFVLGGRHGGAPATEPPATPATSAPASAAPTPPPPTLAPPPEVAPPAKPTPATFAVRLRSEPPGALVTETGSGVLLGVTPFEKRVNAKDGALGVRVAKEGFVGVSLEIPAGTDFDRTVPLERTKSHAHRHESTPASATKPAPTASPVVTARAAVAPPPAVTAPAAAKAKAEKW
jgi:eukaryotic-like serine/threonine-protein kinase